MPKQKGIIKIKGSMGGITFYQSNGQDLSRETNGPDKDKILNDPNFIRTRENNQEFGGAATIGKAFRMGLVQVFDEMSDTTTTARITKLMKSIISLGAGPRGQRDFSPLAYGYLFREFVFDESISFDSVFLAPFSSTVNGARTEVTLTIPDFNSGNSVNAPAGATHFRIINQICVLSQYVFNVTTKKYDPLDPSNTSNAFNASGFIPLGINVGSDTIITASLTPPPTVQAGSALIACIGIEFYQNVAGTQYLLASDNAMKVQNVY